MGHITRKNSVGNFQTLASKRQRGPSGLPPSRDVRGPGGFQWNTSLTRTDTGDGACEIVWVETLETR